MKNYNLKINGTNYSVDIKYHEDNILKLEVNGSLYEVELEKKELKTPIISRTPVIDSKPKEMKSSTGVKKVSSPLPGTIFAIKVKEGDVVKIGTTLLVLEAMKMENDVQSEFSGKIKKINVSKGAAVLQGDILIEIE